MIFPNFQFENATHEDLEVRREFQESYEPPLVQTVWGEANAFRRAMSADGYDLVYHFPDGVSRKVFAVLP